MEKERRGLRSNSNTASPAAREQVTSAKSLSKSPVTLGELQSALDECVAKINDRIETVLNERLESLRNEIKKDFEDKIEKLESKIATQADEIEILRSRQFGTNEGLEALASFSHQQLKSEIRRNVVLTGIPESDGEDDIPAKAVEVLEILGCKRSDAVYHSRVGKSQGGKPRLLKLSFRSFQDRMNALRKSRELRNDHRFRDVYVNADLTFAERSERKRLRAKADKLKGQHPNDEITLRKGELLIDSVTVDSAEPHRLLLFRHK